MTETLTHGAFLAGRHLKNLVRQPWFMIVQLVQPVVWLLLFGALFERVVDLPGFSGHGPYIEFIAPGVVVMMAMFSNSFSGLSTLGDIERGVIDRMLVSPIRRSSLVIGIVAHGAVVTVFQSAVILVLALLAGARFSGGVAGLGLLVLSAVLVGTLLGSLSNGLALLLRRRESVMAVNQFLLMPLTFLSSAFMDPKLAPRFIQRAAEVNPVNLAIEAGRAALSPGGDASVVGVRLAVLALLAAVALWLATRAVAMYQRGV
ncbi:MAG TPA: ABC transporter permease [Polyangiaceae bacterium]|nr:ABC transporter permease [Polyangiaceae bacterium]